MMSTSLKSHQCQFYTSKNPHKIAVCSAQNDCLTSRGFPHYNHQWIPLLSFFADTEYWSYHSLTQPIALTLQFYWSLCKPYCLTCMSITSLLACLPLLLPTPFMAHLNSHHTPGWDCQYNSLSSTGSQRGSIPPVFMGGHQNTGP